MNAPEPKPIKTTELRFTEAERQVVEEAFQPFIQAVNIIARLHGVTGAQLATVQLTPDRSGLLIPEKENK